MRPLVLAVVVAVAGCASDDEAGTTGSTGSTVSAVSTSSIPTTAPSPPTTSDAAVVQPDGFDLAPAQITTADGEVCELCLWVAESAAQRQRGLMGVTDLGVGEGMVFVYEGPASGQFWMRGTPMPLSIAFFGADGEFVSAADMEPCLTGSSIDCARYSAAAQYTAAIEVPQGQLDSLGIGRGSRLALFSGSGCDDVGP